MRDTDLLSMGVRHNCTFAGRQAPLCGGGEGTLQGRADEQSADLFRPQKLRGVFLCWQWQLSSCSACMVAMRRSLPDFSVLWLICCQSASVFGKVLVNIRKTIHTQAQL